jgi:4-amino-4-deoxy-L-arabinose transferase-like glycosyltransferase
MEILKHDNADDSQTKSSSTLVWTRVVVAWIFILAFCLRLYHINEPPLDFEPDREYHSFTLARHYFLEQSSAAPGWRKAVWRQNAENEYMVEPPVLEYLASLLYRVRGREEFWIPKLLSVIFWMIGGFVLFKIVKNALSKESAILSCGYFLLNPFAISASKAFMPNPLMILLFLIAIFYLFKYFESPSNVRLAACGLFSGTAGLVKPFILIPLVSAFVFVSLYLYREKITKAVRIIGLYVLLVIGIASPYYFFRLLTKDPFLTDYTVTSFMPGLWFKPFYWGGWFDLIRNTTGYIPFVLGLLGILIAGKNTFRVLLLGLWAGYLCFGLLFTYHIHTHDYYHLIHLPIVALSLAPLGSLLVKVIHVHWQQLLNRWLLAGIMLFVSAACIHEARTRWKNVEHFIEAEVSTAEEIGQVINHSSKVISLGSHYAKPLKFHAEIGGVRWPYSYDFRAIEIRGQKNIETSARFKEMQTKYSPDYFVVSDLLEFERQKELKIFLENNFEVFKKTDRYIIYSLQRRIT